MRSWCVERKRGVPDVVEALVYWKALFARYSYVRYTFGKKHYSMPGMRWATSRTDPCRWCQQEEGVHGAPLAASGRWSVSDISEVSEVRLLVQTAELAQAVAEEAAAGHLGRTSDLEVHLAQARSNAAFPCCSFELE